MIPAEYFQSSVLAKRDCSAGGIQKSTTGGKMLPRKRSPRKKRGRAYQVRSRKRLVDAIFLALLQ